MQKSGKISHSPPQASSLERRTVAKVHVLKFGRDPITNLLIRLPLCNGLIIFVRYPDSLPDCLGNQCYAKDLKTMKRLIMHILHNHYDPLTIPHVTPLFVVDVPVSTKNFPLELFRVLIPQFSCLAIQR